jgi:hypothetical protein
VTEAADRKQLGNPLQNRDRIGVDGVHSCSLR